MVSDYNNSMTIVDRVEQYLTSHPVIKKQGKNIMKHAPSEPNIMELICAKQGN